MTFEACATPVRVASQKQPLRPASSKNARVRLPLKGEGALTLRAPAGWSRWAVTRQLKESRMQSVPLYNNCSTIFIYNREQAKPRH